jgi:hypothetical protein
MKLKPRYTMTALLAVILIIGLPLAWVRHKLDERAASNKALSDLHERGFFITYHAGLPAHSWYGYFDHVQNPEQADTASITGSRITDDDLRVLDQFVNLREIRISETSITDEGLLHLAKQHQHLRFVSISECKVTRDGVARFRMERPGVPIVCYRYWSPPAKPAPKLYGAAYEPIKD